MNVRRKALFAIILAWALVVSCPQAGVRAGVQAGPAQQHGVAVDPRRLGPVRGIDGILHPLSFVGYEGDLGVWQGELPIVGTPIRLMLHPGGAGILIMKNSGDDGVQRSIAIEAKGALGGVGAARMGGATMQSVQTGIVFFGRSSRGEPMFGVAINGKVVEILFVDPKTGRLVRRIST